MNFIPTPQPWKRMNVNKYIEKQFDDFARRIRINHYFNTQPNDLILLGERMKINTSNSFNPWTPPVESHSVAIEHYLKESKEKLTAELKRANSLSQRRFIGKHSKCPNWLHETLTELQENKDIIVTEADKNMGVVVMSSTSRRVLDNYVIVRLIHYLIMNHHLKTFGNNCQSCFNDITKMLSPQVEETLNNHEWQPTFSNYGEVRS